MSDRAPEPDRVALAPRRTQRWLDRRLTRLGVGGWFVFSPGWFLGLQPWPLRLIVYPDALATTYTWCSLTLGLLLTALTIRQHGWPAVKRQGALKQPKVPTSGATPPAPPAVPHVTVEPEAPVTPEPEERTDAPPAPDVPLVPTWDDDIEPEDFADERGPVLSDDEEEEVA
jgi:hypothetical protein